jgi:hypothetical protein
MQRTPGTIFGPPATGKTAKQRAAKGRQCDHSGCSTMLSTYNASSTCWTHTPPGYRTPLAKS